MNNQSILHLQLPTHLYSTRHFPSKKGINREGQGPGFQFGKEIKPIEDKNKDEVKNSTTSLKSLGKSILEVYIALKAFKIVINELITGIKYGAEAYRKSAIQGISIDTLTMFLLLCYNSN